MFDLITGREKHLPSHATVPILMSTVAQASVIALVAALPLLYVTEQLPEIPTMLAFVAAPPPAPPPPPPPAAAKPKPAQTPPQPVPSQAKFLAPIEEPEKISEIPDDEGFDVGVPGGVEGGIPGGVVGGVVGGLPEAPPPPPPSPVKRAPVRIGGQIQPPQLVHRVEPNYPSFAAKARLAGVVILEAIVDQDGNVTEVTVLRSATPLLDREAEAAVRQWRYSPLVLNGNRERFVLTVTLSFRLQQTE